MKAALYRIASGLLLYGVATVDLAASDSAKTSPDAKEKPIWRVDDLLAAEWASDWKISPDCAWAIWVKTAPENNRNEYVASMYSDPIIMAVPAMGKNGWNRTLASSVSLKLRISIKAWIT